MMNACDLIGSNVMYQDRRVARTVWRGVRSGGTGVEGAGPPAGVRGQSPCVPKIFDIFTENRPFRDLRVHDIGKSSQVECLCKTW